MVNQNEQLDRVFAALSDPTRRAMLARLRAGEATVGALAEPFRMSAPAITKHLNVLERAGLISRHPRGRTRICRLEPGSVRDAKAWFDDQTRHWEGAMDRLEGLLSDEKVKSDG